MMFNFTSQEINGHTIAELGDFRVRFFANDRNTRITSSIGLSNEDEEFRASGTLFFHYDAIAQGDGNRDTGGSQFDHMTC
ncbi:hypothetical protein [Pseudomonas sp. Irchel 3A18]|uniref:hypothetical protein n=1 Tax=Pseudomonas sp. Irchel 3A18 TaxID=2008905 RepID=UPI000BA4D9CA|nr:hypothetical protein [Pseudomonas sp. Irchel 3A18]